MLGGPTVEVGLVSGHPLWGTCSSSISLCLKIGDTETYLFDLL